MAVQVIDEPLGCGAILLAPRVSAVTMAGCTVTGVPENAKSMAADASASSLLLVLLRTHTVIRPFGYAVAGVQANVFAVLQPVAGFQPSS